MFRSAKLCSSALLSALLLSACGAEKKVHGDGGPLDDDDNAANSGDGGSQNGMDGGVGGGNGGPAADPNAPAPVGTLPTYAPKFPGAGQSGDDKPLTNGKLCDYVPANGAPTPNEITTCYFGKGGSTTVPAATLEQVLECADGKDAVHIRLTFNPAFVDNTYGTGAIGWPHRRGHTFADLYKSDHAEILVKNEAGEVPLRFRVDYLTADPTAPSGYGTLGVKGGDGSVIAGNPAWILDTSTSLHKNLNERGYGSYLVDSPLTDKNYTANPTAPNWDYRVVYEAWVDVHAFDPSGFGGATIESVHASPAKGGNDTLIVTPGPCPPDSCTNPDGCYGGPGTGGDGGVCVPAPDRPCDGPNGPQPDAGCVPGPDQYCDGTGGPQPDAGCVTTPDNPCDPIFYDAGVPQPSECELNPDLPKCKPIVID